MNKRTKAVDVPANVRKEVLGRDNHRCIFCKRFGGLTMAHIIPRSQGGLGIKENLVTACSRCHEMMDHTLKRKAMIEYAENHIKKFHEETERIYKK